MRCTGSTSSSSAPTNGRWSANEHTLFLEALNLYGREWKRVADYIKTRNITQIRSHAQKYFANEDLNDDITNGQAFNLPSNTNNSHGQGGHHNNGQSGNPLSPRRHSAIAALGGLASLLGGQSGASISGQSQFNVPGDYSMDMPHQNDIDDLSEFPSASSSSHTPGSRTSSMQYQTPQQQNNNQASLSSKSRKHGSGPVHIPGTQGQENVGRWTKDEHQRFLDGLEQYGKEWKQIAAEVATRSVVQTRTHAQKYFQKLLKAAANDGGRTGKFAGATGHMAKVLMGELTYGSSTASKSKSGKAAAAIHGNHVLLANAFSNGTKKKKKRT